MTDWPDLLSPLHWQVPAMFLLLPVPLLVRMFLPAANNQPAAIRMPQFEQLKAIQTNRPATVRNWPVVMSLVTLWFLLVVAAARPIWYGKPEVVPTSGRDLMMAVDISDSMRVDDMRVQNKRVTRLDSVKDVVASFVENRAGDRIGLILFGHQSFLQAPLTFDHDAVMVQLNEAMAGFAGSSTAIGDVLGLAITQLRGRDADARVLILLTDGANTAGTDPVQAAQIAAEAGIRVHTIGIGAPSRVSYTPAGERREVQTFSKMEEDVLRAIAKTTGGAFFRAHDVAEMASVYDIIDILEPVPEPQTFRPERSLFHWPLGLALMLAIFITLRPSIAQLYRKRGARAQGRRHTVPAQ